MSAIAIPSLVPKSEPRIDAEAGRTPADRPRVVCASVRLRDFRNLAATELEVPAEGVALIGDNGAGKTNLVEAIYYLELFRSFRGAPDDQLARFEKPGFFVAGSFAIGDRTTEVTAGYLREGKRKRVRVDGVEPERLGDALGEVGVVVFSPSDIAVVAGSPSDRRRFLDILLSLNEPGYVDALQSYRHALRQRNALLRAGGGRDLLEPWDDALVRWGVPVLAARMTWADHYAVPFAVYCRTIGDGAGMALRYRSTVGTPERPGAATTDEGAETEAPTDGAAPGAGDARAEDEARAEAEARIEALFREALERRRRREQEIGATVVGPHRDDLALRLLRGDARDVDLRDFGSGGQRRTAAVALRLVEADTIRARRGREPMVLLDDIFAELDTGRSGRLMALLADERAGQLMVTAPKQVDLGARAPLESWTIASGSIAT